MLATLFLKTSRVTHDFIQQMFKQVYAMWEAEAKQIKRWISWDSAIMSQTECIQNIHN